MPQVPWQIEQMQAKELNNPSCLESQFKNGKFLHDNDMYIRNVLCTSRFDFQNIRKIIFLTISSRRLDNTLFVLWDSMKKH